MSQRCGSILICVKDLADWQKLYSMPIDEDWWLYGETGKDIFGDMSKTIWSIDGDWSPEFHGIRKLIDQIYSRLGRENCVILQA